LEKQVALFKPSFSYPLPDGAAAERWATRSTPGGDCVKPAKAAESAPNKERQKPFALNPKQKGGRSRRNQTVLNGNNFFIWQKLLIRGGAARIGRAAPKQGGTMGILQIIPAVIGIVFALLCLLCAVEMVVMFFERKGTDWKYLK